MTEMTNTERVKDIFGAFARGDIPNILAAKDSSDAPDLVTVRCPRCSTCC